MQELTAVLANPLAYFELSEVDVSVLVLDVFGVEGVEDTHTSRVNDNALVVATLFTYWHMSVLLWLCKKADDKCCKKHRENDSSYDFIEF